MEVKASEVKLICYSRILGFQEQCVDKFVADNRY